MPEKERNPKMFLCSLILPVAWFSIGGLMAYFFPDKRLGVAGLVLIVYLAITPISLYMTKCYSRYLNKSEKIRLVIYLTLWALMCEFWALWYHFSLESNPDLGGGALYFTLIFTSCMDLLFMYLGVQFAGSKMFNYFNRKREPEIA